MRSLICAGVSDEVAPCRSVVPPQAAPKRSASVAAQPSCRNGARQADADEARHLEDAAGADVDARVVRQLRPRVAARAGGVRGVLEERLTARDGGSVGGRRLRHPRDGVDPAEQRALLIVGERRPAHAVQVDLTDERAEVRQVARPVERLGAADVPAQRLRAALANHVEVPGAAVFAAFGVARGAGDVGAGVRVEHGQGGVGAAVGRQRHRRLRGLRGRRDQRAASPARASAPRAAR